MNEIEYSAFKNSEKNYINCTAQVSKYGFSPEGTQNDWIEYAQNLANKYKMDVNLYYETEDKQTGHCTDCFISTIKPNNK